MEDKEILNKVFEHSIKCFEESYKKEKDESSDGGTKKVHFGRVGAFLEIIRNYGELINPEEMGRLKENYPEFFNLN